MIARLSLLLLVACMLAASPAMAAPKSTAKPGAQEKLIGTFGGWNAYSYDQGGQTVCYMVTTKLVKSSGAAKRSTPYLMITHRPIEASTDVFSYGAGIALDTRRGVQITTGKASFNLFAVRDIAWARDALTDHKMAAAIKDNASLTARFYPDKHGAKPAIDMFDLTGALAAYHAIGKACGLSDASKPTPSPKKAATPKAR